jgi:hypothetical protein
MATPGQPTLYKPEYIELAHNYCLLGATNETLGDFFGVTSRTIDNWIATHPDFADAVRRGRAVADATVVRALFRPRLRFQPSGLPHHALSRQGADGHQHGVLSARHPGLHVLAAQPPAPLLAGEDGGAAGGRRRHGGAARCRW